MGKVGGLAYDATDLAEHALCMQEANLAGSGAAAKSPWLTRALKEGTFQLVYDCLETLVKVHMFFAEREPAFCALRLSIRVMETLHNGQMLKIQGQRLVSIQHHANASLRVPDWHLCCPVSFRVWRVHAECNFLCRRRSHGQLSSVWLWQGAWRQWAICMTPFLITQAFSRYICTPTSNQLFLRITADLRTTSENLMPLFHPVL